MKASMPRVWPARRVMRERFCCDGGCNENQGRGGCPQFERSETLPIPLGVPTGEHRPASLLMRVLRWFK